MGQARPSGIDYQGVMRSQMMGGIKQVVADVSKHGLPGGNHFSITFSTNHPDAEIPDWLLAKYPEAMTVMLQHSFWDLAVDGDDIRVTLAFGKDRHTLVIPLDSILVFADPYAEFMLQFPPSRRIGEGRPAAEQPAADKPAGRGNVVDLCLSKKKS